MSALLSLLVLLDRAINALLGGSFHETLSARAHRLDVRDHPYWGWTARFINALFFWQALVAVAMGGAPHSDVDSDKKRVILGSYFGAL